MMLKYYYLSMRVDLKEEILNRPQCQLCGRMGHLYLYTGTIMMEISLISKEYNTNTMPSNL